MTCRTVEHVVYIKDARLEGSARLYRFAFLLSDGTWREARLPFETGLYGGYLYGGLERWVKEVMQSFRQENP